MTAQMFMQLLPRTPPGCARWEGTTEGEFVACLTGCFGTVEFRGKEPNKVAAAAHAWEAIWATGVEISIEAER